MSPSRRLAARRWVLLRAVAVPFTCAARVASSWKGDPVFIGFVEVATNLPDLGARQLCAITEWCLPELLSGVAYSDPLVRFLLVEDVLQLGDEGGLERERLGDHSVE